MSDEKKSSLSTLFLPFFLRRVASNIETNQITNHQWIKVIEFFLSYFFLSETRKNLQQMNEKDTMKFFVLGWFVYTQLLPTVTE